MSNLDIARMEIKAAKAAETIVGLNNYEDGWVNIWCRGPLFPESTMEDYLSINGYVIHVRINDFEQAMPQIFKAMPMQSYDYHMCPVVLDTPDGLPLPCSVMYIDIDNRRSLRELDRMGLPPAFWWETSPGSIQAIWQLAEPVGWGMFDELRKGLIRVIGADPSPLHHETMVYHRIPSTFNLKPTRRKTDGSPCPVSGLRRHRGTKLAPIYS